jgi:acyl-CoA thioesterase
VTTFDFDEDTGLKPVGDGRWRGAITDRWMIARGPNGGYVGSFPIKAMLAASPFPDPLTMTTHYVNRPEVATVEIAVEELRMGRSHATVEARMHQGSRLITVSVATFGTLKDSKAESVQAEMPTVVPPDEAIASASIPGAEQSFRQRFEHRMLPGHEPAWLTGRSGPAEVMGWTRLADGRPLDAAAVPLFMDCWPPPMFNTFLGGFAPTIELTVHWRNKPTTEWHLCRFRSRFAMHGYVEEDGELWGEDGRLVAQSRQLARFEPPE